MQLSIWHLLQTVAEVLLPPIQTHPSSMLQVEVQPSPLLEFPSSQYPAFGTVPIILPSPHKSVHTLLLVGVPRVHFQPASVDQVSLQPSV